MRHKHAEMIIEWAKDTSKIVQILDDEGGDGGWVNVRNPSWGTCSEYRFKPREFNEGEWYPCVDNIGDRCILMFNGGLFSLGDSCRSTGGMHNQEKLQWIGESLGKLNFNN